MLIFKEGSLLMKKVILLMAVIMSFAMADSYKLFLDTDGGQGAATFPTDSSVTYQHDGSVVPTTVAWVLDSIQLHAVDAANNVGPTAWIFIKITPVNDNAPVVASDTVTVVEGGSKTWSPGVTDADN